MDDAYVRSAAFDWLRGQLDAYGDVLPWSLLLQGFVLRGERVPLLSQQGIFKPRVMQYPLSIRSAVGGHYDDKFIEDDQIEYMYRGTNPRHRDNVGLRETMRRRLPLVYFFGIEKGRYMVTFPVFIVGDDPGRLTFTVDLAGRLQAADGIAEPRPELQRAYTVASVRQRLHQRTFRERVLAAYRERCAICRLRHRELLDATHIIPDSEKGEPRVTNGLALCKLHHAAFDKLFLGIRPDYRIVVRRDVLEEEDGPMLRHGLQGIEGTTIQVPQRVEWRPDPNLLDIRFARFQEAW